MNTMASGSKIVYTTVWLHTKYNTSNLEFYRAKLKIQYCYMQSVGIRAGKSMLMRELLARVYHTYHHHILDSMDMYVNNPFVEKLCSSS